MPAGKVHAKATKLAIAPSGILTFIILSLFFSEFFTLEARGLYSFFVATGVWTGLHIHPDLDLLENTFKSKVKKPNLFHKYWWFRWLAYAEWAEHRSFKSHSLIFSTVIRILYISLEPALILCILSDHIQTHHILIACGWWAIGLFISDSLHIIMDVLSTWWRKKLRRRIRRYLKRFKIF